MRLFLHRSKVTRYKEFIFITINSKQFFLNFFLIQYRYNYDVLNNMHSITLKLCLVCFKLKILNWLY